VRFKKGRGSSVLRRHTIARDPPDENPDAWEPFVEAGVDGEGEDDRDEVPNGVHQAVSVPQDRAKSPLPAAATQAAR
jgi:hypothetical protein